MASSKIKSKKEYQILVPDKKRLYILMWLFYPSLKFDTLSQNLPLPNQLPFLQKLPIILWCLEFEIKIKNKKKEGKGKFQVYKKASSSLRFLIKSPPIRFATTLCYAFTPALPRIYRVVFFQKNLLFWNLPLERLAFFFSFFSFE